MEFPWRKQGVSGEMERARLAAQLDCDVMPVGLGQDPPLTVSLPYADEVAGAVGRMLSRQRCALWGQAFGLTSHAEREMAHAWLAEQVSEVLDEVRAGRRAARRK